MTDPMNAPEKASPFNIPDTAQIDRRDDAQFRHEIKRILKRAEELRLGHMRRYQLYKNIAITVSLSAMIFGTAACGWFLLMDVDLVKALASLIVSVSLPIAANMWSDNPIEDYQHDHKTKYMPELAQLMGGFEYHPKRGISENVITKTGVIPPYKTYKSEDCFRGLYKGCKVLFSEGRLFDKKKRPVFKGLFVLLEIPNKIFEGHTIITADRDMAEGYQETRWSKLSPVPLSIENKRWDRFVAFSDHPQDAQLLLGERLIKELAEADIAFGNANMTTVLFRGKYIFLMIPHEKDMFEASGIQVPVGTDAHALACKKEIEQLLEVIDIFDLYGAQN